MPSAAAERAAAASRRWSSRIARQAVHTTSISSSARIVWFPERSPRRDSTLPTKIWCAPTSMPSGWRKRISAWAVRFAISLMSRGMIRLWPQFLQCSIHCAVPSRALRRTFAPNEFWPLSKTISKTPTGTRRSGQKKYSSRLSSTLRRPASVGAISARPRWPNRRFRTPSLWTCLARRTNAVRPKGFGAKPNRNTNY